MSEFSIIPSQAEKDLTKQERRQLTAFIDTVKNMADVLQLPRSWSYQINVDPGNDDYAAEVDVARAHYGTIQITVCVPTLAKSSGAPVEHFAIHEMLHLAILPYTKRSETICETLYDGLGNVHRGETKSPSLKELGDLEEEVVTRLTNALYMSIYGE